MYAMWIYDKKKKIVKTFKHLYSKKIDPMYIKKLEKDGYGTVITEKNILNNINVEEPIIFENGEIKNKSLKIAAISIYDRYGKLPTYLYKYDKLVMHCRIYNSDGSLDTGFNGHIFVEFIQKPHGYEIPTNMVVFDISIKNGIGVVSKSFGNYKTGLWYFNQYVFEDDYKLIPFNKNGEQLDEYKVYITDRR